MILLIDFNKKLIGNGGVRSGALGSDFLIDFNDKAEGEWKGEVRRFQE